MMLDKDAVTLYSIYSDRVISAVPVRFREMLFAAAAGGKDMKIRRAFIILLPLVAILLCGCMGNGKSNAEPNGKSNENEKADNRFNDCMACVAETDSMVLFSDESNFLYYYDKEADQSGVLCGKPECTHDKWGSNGDCSGCFFKGAFKNCLSVSGDRFYIVCSSGRNFELYSAKLDSSDRKKEGLVVLPENTAAQSFYYYKGVLYTLAISNVVDALNPCNQVRLIADDIKSGEQTIVVDRTLDPDKYYPSAFVRFIEDDIYFMISDKTFCELYRMDLATQELETVLYGEDIPGVTGLWITDEGEIYLSTNNETAAINRLEDGVIKPVFEFSEEGMTYYAPYLSDGIACSVGVDENNDSFLWVVDLAGETIYKGPFPSAYAAQELGVDPVDILFGGIGGNRDELIIQMLAETDTGEFGFLLQCKMKDGAMEEKIIVKERESKG